MFIIREGWSKCQSFIQQYIPYFTNKLVNFMMIVLGVCHIFSLYALARTNTAMDGLNSPEGARIGKRKKDKTTPWGESATVLEDRIKPEERPLFYKRNRWIHLVLDYLLTWHGVGRGTLELNNRCVQWLQCVWLWSNQLPWASERTSKIEWSLHHTAFNRVRGDYALAPHLLLFVRLTSLPAENRH